MPSCEKCWRDAHRGPDTDVAEEYRRLLEERRGDLCCTPREQAGEHAAQCPECLDWTMHQHANVCMNCGFDGGLPGVSGKRKPSEPGVVPDTSATAAEQENTP